LDIDQHIMRVLATATTPSRPVTIGDLARQFGVSPTVVVPAARRLLDNGLASPFIVKVHGVPTLRGLVPLPVSTRLTEWPR
jgi:DNA-binding MarR family transcriptional regulator